ncbi:MAG TPA: hypothetical protein VKQ36_07805 [Ktedonobacterales bacterium]|nr:hypothetical protein [Ktedonobacterales bacterium]
MLICPYCEQPLTRVERAYHCPAGHNFDIARQGYVNLLAQPTCWPADSQAMLQARRRFLARGFYTPLAEAICAQVIAWLEDSTVADAPSSDGVRVLDAGCGEGYYVWRLEEALARRDVSTGQHPIPRAYHLYGADLAREAMWLATSLRNIAHELADMKFSITWLVVNIKASLPFASESLHAVLSIFAPRNPTEFARILAPGGLLLMVIPEPDHLRGAREALRLLEIEPQKRDRVISQFTADGAFTLVSSQRLAYPMTLDADAQRDLGAMTPGARWRSGATDIREPSIQTQCACLRLCFARGRL